MTEYKKQLIELAKEYKLPFSIVDQIFNSQFKFARETIEAIDIKGVSKEELKNIKTNFNFKYIGKLYAVNKNLNKKGDDKFYTKSKLGTDNELPSEESKE